MTRLCIVTSDGRAYYALASRLRKAGFSFLSLTPEKNSGGCEIILTTRKEAGLFRGGVMFLDDLDDDPSVLRGQVLSRLDKGDATLLVGVDPGSRTGMAAFYGENALVFRTFHSRDALCATISRLVGRVEAKRSLIRIGNGNPVLARSLAETLSSGLPKTRIEIVDESGTSVRGPHTKGLQTDAGAAAKIALRKGEAFGSAT